MKKGIVIFTILVIILVNCKKEEAMQITFNPTDIFVSNMGSHMRLTIQGPFNGYYNFSSDTSVFDFTGEEFYAFQVPINEMEELTKKLSDTIIFDWKIATSVLPYTENECILLVFGEPGYGTFMCSIGYGNTSAIIIQELSKSITGKAKEGFDEIAVLLSD